MNEYNKEIISLEQIINKNEYNIIEFYASWCGPCKMMVPVLESLEKEYQEIAFTKIDIDANIEFKENYEIKSVPTILIIKKGIIIERTEGFIPEVKLKKIIEESLK